MACTSLVVCLPSLESIKLRLPGPLFTRDLGCLLEALAWCPRLRALDLEAVDGTRDERDGAIFLPSLGLERLRSLSKLSLHLGLEETHSLADVVGALVSLTDLAELELTVEHSYMRTHHRPDVVPAALGQLKGLRSLKFRDLESCSLEAGCLDLPRLLSLDFRHCKFRNAAVLPGVSALQSLTRIEISQGCGPRFFDPQLVQLHGLQRMVFKIDERICLGGALGLTRIPADMGALRSSVLHLDCTRQGLTQFPLALTQLVALKCLKAGGNEFAELPAGIRALSRLTELALGRFRVHGDVMELHDQRPLDVRVLGDLSAFPALCMLSFSRCEVTMCQSMLGAARHASLKGLTLSVAHPAPECALMVLQLSHSLNTLGRGRVLRFVDDDFFNVHLCSERVQQALQPLLKFKAALEACGLQEEREVTDLRVVGTHREGLHDIM